jgi:hypothetical protein
MMCASQSTVIHVLSVVWLTERWDSDQTGSIHDAFKKLLVSSPLSNFLQIE